MGRDKHGRKKRSSKHSKKHKHDSWNAAEELPGHAQQRKLFKYASLGKLGKLRALLGDGQANAARLVGATDIDGATALHQAARHGHLAAVQLLLRRASNASSSDASGNTPGHLAAMHGHWLVLSELIKAADIDLDKPNAAGFSIREIVQHQHQGSSPSPSAGGARSSSPSPSSPHSSSQSGPADSSEQRAAKRARLTAAGAPGGSSAAGGAGLADAAEDDWMDKLAYEMSYDEPGSWHGAWGAAMAAAAAAGTSSPRRGGKALPRCAAADMDTDDEDAWADRLWQDMQEHRRQAAAAAASRGCRHRPGSGSGAAAFGAGHSRESVAAERERRAAAAAAESARILREEQAKDADWRAAMTRQVEEAALPLRRSTYEEAWRQLEAWPASKVIRYQDIPWPCPTPGSQAAARKQQAAQQQQQQQHGLHLDPKQLQTLVLAGAGSAEDVKRVLRRELMRWHPDKFTARYGARLAPADRDAIQAGVHAVAQQLTALKQQ